MAAAVIWRSGLLLTTSLTADLSAGTKAGVPLSIESAGKGQRYIFGSNVVPGLLVLVEIDQIGAIR